MQPPDPPRGKRTSGDKQERHRKQPQQGETLSEEAARKIIELNDKLAAANVEIANLTITDRQRDAQIRDLQRQLLVPPAAPIGDRGLLVQKIADLELAVANTRNLEDQLRLEKDKSARLDAELSVEIAGRAEAEKQRSILQKTTDRLAQSHKADLAAATNQLRDRIDDLERQNAAAADRITKAD